MAKSQSNGLPHGMVPIHQLPDPQMRDVVMKLNENIHALAKRVAALERKGKEK